MLYACALGATLYRFADLKALLGRASPPRAGDRLAGLAADSAEECVAARLALADLPLVKFLEEPLIPYEADEVTRLIVDSHDRAAFAPVAALTVGGFRDFLLSDAATTDALAALAPRPDPGNGGRRFEADAQSGSDRGREKDLRRHALSHHDRPAGTSFDPAAAQSSKRRSRRHRRRILDGLMYGCGDACIGINPATDSAAQALRILDCSRICACASISQCKAACSRMSPTMLQAMAQGGPVDLVFQSVAGSEAANRAFGVEPRAA